MTKRNLPKEVHREIESSDEEFYFDSLNTEFGIEFNNACFENVYTSDSGSENSSEATSYAIRNFQWW